MEVIVLQAVAALIFAVGSLLLGLWVRRSPEKKTAENASRYSHLMYWSCLVLPSLIGFLYPGLTHYDELLGVPSLPFRSGTLFVGALLVVVGMVLLIASNQSLIKVGKGAAAFLLTKQVVSERVYQLVRNPMSLGYYLTCVGVSLLARSTTLTVGALLIVITIQLFNLKYFEEVELELRYGQTYREYKQRVPFLIPSFTRKKERRV